MIRSDTGYPWLLVCPWLGAASVLAVISSQGNIDICLCRDAHRAVLPCTSARSDDAVRIYGVPLLIIVRFMALRC